MKDTREQTVDLIVARIVNMELEVFGDHLSIVQLENTVRTLLEEEPVIRQIKSMTATETK